MRGWDRWAHPSGRGTPSCWLGWELARGQGTGSDRFTAGHSDSPAGALTGAPQNPQDRGLWGNTPGLVLPADFSVVASDSLQHRAGMVAGSFQLLGFERQL